MCDSFKENKVVAKTNIKMYIALQNGETNLPRGARWMKIPMRILFPTSNHTTFCIAGIKIVID